MRGVGCSTNAGAGQAPSLGAALSGTGVQQEGWQEAPAAEAAPGSTAGCRAAWCGAGADIGERLSAWLSDHLDAWSLVLFPVTYSIMTVVVFSV